MADIGRRSSSQAVFVGFAQDIRPAQPEFSLPVLPALGVTLQAAGVAV